LAWWMTWAPKFLPMIQFHPGPPLLSISFLRYLERTFSGLFYLMDALRPSLRYWRTRSISYWSMSVALTWGLASGADIEDYWYG
jgi:hypothetical protein